MPILQNAIRILENGKYTYLVSSHTHDFRSHEFADGTGIFVDGGRDYIRRGGSALSERGKKWADFSIEASEDIQHIKDLLLWGQRYDAEGKLLPDGLQWVLLKECSTPHLKAILDWNFPTGKAIKGTIYERVIKLILKERKEYPLTKRQAKGKVKDDVSHKTRSRNKLRDAVRARKRTKPRL